MNTCKVTNALPETDIRDVMVCEAYDSDTFCVKSKTLVCSTKLKKILDKYD